jgi:hypothetical protein
MARRPLAQRSTVEDDGDDRIANAIARAMRRIASLPLRDPRARRARRGLRRLRQWASARGHRLQDQ